MLLVPLVTVLPPASWTATTGWIGNGWAVVADVGWAVKPSFVAGPAATVKLEDVAELRLLPDATSVYVPTLSILQRSGEGRHAGRDRHAGCW